MQGTLPPRPLAVPLDGVIVDHAPIELVQVPILSKAAYSSNRAALLMPSTTSHGADLDGTLGNVFITVTGARHLLLFRSSSVRV